MELKYFASDGDGVTVNGSNRTFMELKFEFQMSVR